MRPRTLLILLVVVLGLGAFIWFYERDLPSSEEREELAKKILPVEKAEIQAVTLEFDGQQVALERVEAPPAPKEEEEKEDAEGGSEDAFGEGEDPEAGPDSGEWRMTRPLQARADAFAVDGFLESLTNLQKTRTLEGAVPAEVGLDKPQAVVRLRLKSGEERVLRIGAAVPTGGALIAQAGDTTAVVSDTILPEIRREPGTWRDRRLFTADREDVQSVRLNAPGANSQAVALVQKGPGFRIEGPVNDAAARERVEELFSDLSGLSAESFVDQPDRTPAEMGLQPPQAVVQVAVKGKPPVRIELGAPVDAPAPEPEVLGEEAGPQPALRWARVDGQLVQARTGLVEMATRPVADWRSGLLSSFEVHQIEKVEVQDGANKLSLTRAGTDWKRGEETVSYVPVSDLLFAVTGAEAVRLLTPGEIQLGQPALTFTLQGKETAAETVTLFPGTPQGVPARVSGRGAVLLLPAGKLQEIRDRLKAVRDAKPMTEEETEE
ncbi:MAG TPA: DUF4340 domain-containing protein [Thermoanaerobaculia bacterium]|nr:DUF4340 domain-containing protein [Thermoanaerobaculia bacterium]